MQLYNHVLNEPQVTRDRALRGFQIWERPDMSTNFGSGYPGGKTLSISSWAALHVDLLL